MPVMHFFYSNPGSGKRKVKSFQEISLRDPLAKIAENGESGNGASPSVPLTAANS